MNFQQSIFYTVTGSTALFVSWEYSMLPFWIPALMLALAVYHTFKWAVN